MVVEMLLLSQDGFTVISENKMKEYFTDKSEEILALPKDYKYNVYGVYDKRFEEYIIAFEEHQGNAPLRPPSEIPEDDEVVINPSTSMTTERVISRPAPRTSTPSSGGGMGGY